MINLIWQTLRLLDSGASTAEFGWIRCQQAWDNGISSACYWEGMRPQQVRNLQHLDGRVGIQPLIWFLRVALSPVGVHEVQLVFQLEAHRGPSQHGSRRAATPQELSDLHQVSLLQSNFVRSRRSNIGASMGPGQSRDSSTRNPHRLSMMGNMSTVKQQLRGCTICRDPSH